MVNQTFLYSFFPRKSMWCTLGKQRGRCSSWWYNPHVFRLPLFDLVHRLWTIAYGCSRLHRCWRQMLWTKCADDNFEMLVTLMTAFITYYLYLWTVATCTDEDVINIEILSPTWSHQHTLVRNSFLTYTCINQREVVAFWINIGDIKIKFCWHCPPTNEYFPYPVLSIIINRKRNFDLSHQNW